MDIGNKINSLPKIKLVLIFFLLVFSLTNCGKSKEEVYHLNYENGRAVSLSFKNKENLKVYKQSEQNVAVLGKYIKKKDQILFQPIIPFTAGITYEIRQGKTIVGTFKLNENQNYSEPTILNIYPTSDTVPQNLLKVYIEFSEPMQATANALDFIKVLDKNTDKELPVFLELENDLWNKDHSIATLWLDPGRIKQDLIPNRRHGTPLESGNSYSILISDNWKSEKGISLDSAYIKKLVVKEKKGTRPDVSTWRLTLPIANSRGNLRIDFPEIMDSQLLLNTISIIDETGKIVNGNIKLINQERGLLFTPIQDWETGGYTLNIETRLEDLGGNNLSRLFDTDLHQPEKKMEVINTLKFIID